MSFLQTQPTPRPEPSLDLLVCTLDTLNAAVAVADERGILITANLAWRLQEAGSHPLIPPTGAWGGNLQGFCESLLRQEDLASFARGVLGVLSGQECRFVQDFTFGSGPDMRGYGVTVSGFDVEGSRRIVVAIADITARMQTDRRLRDNEEMFRVISESAGDMVSLMTEEGQRVYFNPAYSRILGYSMDELALQDPAEIVHPEDRERIRNELRELFATGRENQASYRLRHKDGTWRNLEGRAALVQGGPSGMRLAIIVARDVTERVRADLERLQDHAIKNLILEHSNLGIVFVRNRVFEWTNSRWAEILGRPMSEIQGAPTRIAYPDEASYDALSRAAYPAMARRERVDLSWQMVRGDGTTFWCRMIGRPLDEAHPGEGSVWIMEDITDRINAEQERLALEVQLRQAQKLEAIGHLAAGIAHEINTPTQYIGDNINFLSDGFQDLLQALDALEAAVDPAPEALRQVLKAADLAYLRDEIPKAIEQSQEGIGRVTRIVRAMKEFSHPGSDAPVEVDLNRAVESTVIVSRNEWKYVADLETDLDPGLGPVTCHPNEINQAVLNLIVNAAHAVSEAFKDRPGAKGTITVSTRRAGAMAEIRVRDTGTGIPEKARARIFEPFYTTKPVGLGTGQGLAIVFNAVTRHKGTVRFETELGKGSEFILTLPISGPSARAGDAR